MISRFDLVLFLLAASAFLVAQRALPAGNQVGNGGHVVACGQGLAARRELLDLYEAGLPLRPQLKRPLGPGDGIAEASELASDRLASLERVHPRLARQFRTRLAALPREIELRPGALLARTGDSLELSLPAGRGCRLEQLAIRVGQPDLAQKPFVLSRDLWSSLPAETRAALLLHETIYEYFSKLGETDSRKTRRFNARILTDQPGSFSRMSVADYWRYVASLKIPLYPEPPAAVSSHSTLEPNP